MRSYPRYAIQISNSLIPDGRIGLGFLYKKPEHNGRPIIDPSYPNSKSPTATQRQEWPKIQKRKKREKKFLPNPIPEQPPVCSCAENRTGPKQALRLVRPHAPLVVRKARKTLG